MDKYLMITGSYPPDICGVGDYTSCFMNAADANKWQLFYSKAWNISSFFSVIHQINQYDFTDIVIQYPTMGYGWSLLPQLLCFYYTIFTKKRVTIVLHEFSQRTLKAKIASLLFFVSHKIILTSDFEKQFAHNNFCISNKKLEVVKIISNIRSTFPFKQWSQRSIDLAYFGLLRPEKGLEDFFEIADQLHATNPKLRITIIGKMLPENTTYINSLVSTNSASFIELVLNRSLDEVSILLNDTKVTFLPFPDGVSERRGSFLAAISNGSIVVSYEGKHTPQVLNDIYFRSHRHSAQNCIMKLLLEYSDEDALGYQNKCRTYLNTNLPSSWKDVVSFYESVI